MKRRGFLKFFGGAVAAAPAMASQAAASGSRLLAGLPLLPTDLKIDGSGINSAVSADTGVRWDSMSGQKKRLAKLLTRALGLHDHERKRHHIYAIDPDIAVLRSVALHRKMAMQREREYWRDYHGEIADLEAAILYGDHDGDNE